MAGVTMAITMFILSMMMTTMTTMGGADVGGASIAGTMVVHATTAQTIIQIIIIMARDIIRVLQ
ncbi:MAG: hypothetical protein L0Y39_09855 [Methylococcaceae bacterium]|nr:hypothetical protein [Methylococcaceae bacterium]